MTARPADPSDETLLARAATGDRAAFDTLAQRYLLRLYRVARTVLADPAAAEDVAQETLVRAWQRAAEFDPSRARVSTWLHRIAVNQAIDLRRRVKRAPAELTSDLPDPSPGIVGVLEERQRRDALALAIARLPERQRQAVLLTYAQGHAGNEVAGRLGVSARAVEGLLRRARTFLRDCLLARDA